MAKQTDATPAGACLASSYSLYDFDPQFDGQWQGITAATDGACYFASSTHSYRRGAALYRFSPDAGTVSVLASDITTVCGENPAETAPQGKIHSPIVEADGWLYFSTHLGNYWDGAPERYPGAHVIGYHMRSGKFRDFGVVRDRFTIYSAIGVDPQRNKLFAFVVPWAPEDVANDGCHVFRISLDSGEKEDLGRIGAAGRVACFWFFVDHTGDCWFSMWSGNGAFAAGGHGHLYRLRADADRVEVTKDILPDCRVMYTDEQPLPGGEQAIANRGWTWASATRERDRCLFLQGMFGGDDERLWSFTPPQDQVTRDDFHSIGCPGPTFLATALGGDRVYYIQRENLAAARGWVAEFERDRDPDSIGWVEAVHRENLHLKSISISPTDHGTVIDHGQITDQDGRTPRHIDSLAADDAGRVYMVGSWHLLPGEPGTQQILWETTREFVEVKRGERFAYVDTR